MAQADFTEEPVVAEGQPEQTEPAASTKRPTRKTVIYTGFGGFLLFLLAVSVFFYYNFKTVEVEGNSMEPTLKPGQRLLVCKAYWLVGQIKDGDIVVINNPFERNEVIIKRVYRTQGETVDLQNVPDSWDVTQGQYVVPQGTIFVLGDNPAVSQDSRFYGPFDSSSVIGKVVVVQSALGTSD